MKVTPQRRRWIRLLKKERQCALASLRATLTPQNGAVAGGGDTRREKDGAVAELAVVVDLFIAGIEEKVGTLSQRAVAPFLEFGVEEFCAITDLGGADGGAAKLLDDGGDFAGGDA
jgi:hypothetical protein